MNVPTTLLLLAATAFAAPALAVHSQGYCETDSSMIGIVQVGGPAPELTFYVDQRSSFLLDVWIYHESNGVYFAGATPHENLQRGGASPTGVYTDSCRDVGEWEPDTLLY